MKGVSQDDRMIVENVSDADISIKHAGKITNYPAKKEIEVWWLAGDHAIAKHPKQLVKKDEFKLAQKKDGPELEIKAEDGKIEVKKKRRRKPKKPKEPAEPKEEKKELPDLDNMSMEELREFAEKNNLEAKDTSKKELIEEIKKELGV